MKRLLSAIFAFLASACFAGCWIAVWWIWSIKAPTIAKTTRAFNEADRYLSIADKAVGDVTDQLNVQAALVQATARSGNSTPGFFGSFFGKTVVRQLAASVNDAQLTLQRVTEASIVVNSILGTLEEEPLDSLGRLDTNQLRNLQTQMDAVTKASWDIGAALNQSPGSAQQTTADKAQRIAANLRAMVGMLTEFQQRIQALQSRVRHLQTRTLFWMNAGPTLATVALSWAAVSQVVVVWVSVKSMRRKPAV